MYNALSFCVYVSKPLLIHFTVLNRCIDWTLKVLHKWSALLTYCTWRRLIIFPPSKPSDSCNITPPPLFLAHASGFVALSPTPRPYTEKLLKSKFEYSLYLKMWLLLFLISNNLQGKLLSFFYNIYWLIMLVGQEICVYRNVCFGTCIIINIIVWDTSGLIEFFQQMLGDFQHFQLIFTSYFGPENQKWCPCCHCKIIPNVIWKYNLKLQHALTCIIKHRG